MKKDDELKKLFDDYADEQTPKDYLSSKARQSMISSQQREHISSSRPHNGWLHLVWIAPVLCVLLIVSLLVASPLFKNLIDGGINEDSEAPSAPQSGIQYYTLDQVKGRRVAREQYDDILCIARLEQAGYTVVGEKYYAFFTEDDQLRYVKALLGVRSENGDYTELQLIAEADGYVRTDLSYAYGSGSGRNEFVYTSDFDSDSGEYVTKGYFEARQFHFYVVALNGHQCYDAYKIISQIL